jgi:hypothetical protein
MGGVAGDGEDGGCAVAAQRVNCPHGRDHAIQTSDEVITAKGGRSPNGRAIIRGGE